MNKFRLFRDVGLLLVGGIVLFGLYTLVNMYGAKKQSENRSEFSNARRVAELSIKSQNWQSAIASNKKLAEQDPFNGHAWYHQATASYSVVDEARRGLDDLEKENADPETISAAETALNENILSAREVFLSCLDFARYRNRSRIYLASLESMLDNKEKALDHLELAVKDGFYNRQFRISRFGSLRDSPRFADILRMENENKNRRPAFNRPQVRRN